MTVDVACVGAPFLDLIFRGLPALPAPGEERGAEQLVVVPGAIANVAFALRRLGLEAVVCSPVGTDPPGRLLQELMATAGIPWIGSAAAVTPVSVSLPVEGDRALVTSTPVVPVEPVVVERLEPRAVVTDLPNAPLIPPGPVVYAVLGEPEATSMAGRLSGSLADLRAVIVNEREARILTGGRDGPESARLLAGWGAAAIVTLGRAGACAATPDGGFVSVPTTAIEIRDATGAGDLVTAAFVWADLLGRDLGACLEVAVRYASWSLAEAPVGQKGLTRAAFARALADAGVHALDWVSAT